MYTIPYLHKSTIETIILEILNKGVRPTFQLAQIAEQTFNFQIKLQFKLQKFTSAFGRSGVKLLAISFVRLMPPFQLTTPSL